MNNPCRSPLCCSRYVPAILSVANLAPYLWPLNCCGLRPQWTMAAKGWKEGICDLSNVVVFSHNINLTKISPKGNTGYTVKIECNCLWSGRRQCEEIHSLLVVVLLLRDIRRVIKSTLLPHMRICLRLCILSGGYVWLYLPLPGGNVFCPELFQAIYHNSY